MEQITERKTKSATFQMRVSPEIKQAAEELYSDLGMSLSDAVTLFFYQSLRCQGLPFSVDRQGRKKASQNVYLLGQFHARSQKKERRKLSAKEARNVK